MSVDSTEPREIIERDNALYERYGKPLEEDHVGEYVAISEEGEILLSEDLLALVDQALERFGSGKVALRKVGFDAVGSLRILHNPVQRLVTASKLIQ